MRSYVAAKRQATRWLRGGLVVVWVVVAWRTGATAIGYSLRAFEADLQSLLSTAPINTVPLRHPYGGVVELTAEELRSAYWIAPHLDWAGLCFVQGAWLSVLIWLGSLAYPRYSDGEHAEQQYDAEQARKGLWTGPFITPWNWRAGQR